jgi:arylsulfatase A-like enzyme
MRNPREAGQVPPGVWRSAIVTLAVVSMLGATLATAMPARAQARRTPAQARPAGARPNIVLIVTDDVGYGDIGSYGAPDVKTPHIDRLAREGTRFTDFYAAPTCTPTRASLISGRYYQRSGLEHPLGHGASRDAERGLAADGWSLPQQLKGAGYATALFGKWHLGYQPANSPLAHGFETFFGFKSGYIDYYQHTDGNGRPDLFENDRPVQAEGYMTDLITERSVAFVESHTRQPFFLEVAYNAAHWPFQVPGHPSVAAGNARFVQPQDADTSTRQDYVAVLERADQGVGTILAALERTGLAATTLVIFTNDNGGEWLSRNAPLFHRKDTVWEGGIRVPLVMRWPGRVPAKRVTPQVGITMDLTATILAAAGVTVPPAARPDGIDLMPIVDGRAGVVERTLFFRNVLPARTQRAVRQGDWKLVVDGPNTMVFNVRADLGERTDLARTRPDLARRLRPLLAAWEAEVDRPSAAPSGPPAPAK